MILHFPEVRIAPLSCVMVDGSFDPLHEGHIQYFKEASGLGLPVLCNVAPDSWTVEKHPVLLEISRRARVLEAIRYITFVLVGCESTHQALEIVKPRFFAKGSDWLAKGGIPNVELDTCAAQGTEVVYLDTIYNSSTDLIRQITSSKDT